MHFENIIEDFGSHIFGKPYIAANKTLNEAFYDSCSKNDSQLYAIFPDEQYSYGRIMREADMIATSIISFGLNKGDRVGLWSQNSPKWLIVVSLIYMRN